MFKIRQTCNFVMEKAQHYGSSRPAVVTGAGAGLAVVSTSSNAALNAGVATGLTTLTTDFNSLLDLAYPVMITIVVAMVIFGMVKGFIHKAAGK